MSRSRSLKKHQRKAKKHPAVGADAKPASAPAAAAKPVSPVPTPDPAPKNPPKDPSTRLVRRAAHANRKLKAKVRLLEKKVEHLSACEKHLAQVRQQLAAATTQIGELNSAVHHLLSQPPHNGRYHDKKYGLSTKWGRYEWECPVRWDQN